MRLVAAATLTVTLALASVLVDAQSDPDRVIPGGGIHVAGWIGVIDASSIKQGRVLNDARFAQEGNALHVTTGPAATYWNPANTAAGDYTVRATFLEAKFMNLNSHPHSYGLFIVGSNMGTDKMSLLYCVTYGDGTMLVRGFGPAVFTVLRPSPNPAVHKAAAVDQPVTQEVAWRVRGSRAECVINGTVAAGYDKAELMGSGKLQSTDGVFGLRFTHNVEAIITGFGVTKG
jgi:hypothetical protein